MQGKGLWKTFMLWKKRTWLQNDCYIHTTSRKGRPQARALGVVGAEWQPHDMSSHPPLPIISRMCQPNLSRITEMKEVGEWEGERCSKRVWSVAVNKTFGPQQRPVWLQVHLRLLTRDCWHLRQHHRFSCMEPGKNPKLELIFVEV